MRNTIKKSFWSCFITSLGLATTMMYAVANPEKVFQEGNIIATIPDHPIGGNRGVAGTIILSHSDQMPFMKFSKEDLFNLNHIIQIVFPYTNL